MNRLTDLNIYFAGGVLKKIWELKGIDITENLTQKLVQNYSGAGSSIQAVDGIKVSFEVEGN